MYEVEKDVLVPLVATLVKLSWLELSTPTEANIIELVDEVFKDEPWLKVSIYYDGPITYRVFKYDYTERLLVFLINYLAGKVIDLYLAKRNCGSVYFYKFLRANSPNSISSDKVSLVVILNNVEDISWFKKTLS